MLKVNFLYFSPTKTTYKLGTEICQQIIYEENLQNYKTYDISLPEKRLESLSFSEDDLLIIGLPVYAGRLPNILLPYLKTIRAEGAKVIAFVNYGNRNYDNALLELRDLMREAGGRVFAAGAFIGEHAFSYELAAGRPDDEDLSKARDFASLALKKLKSLEASGPPFEDFHIKGDSNNRGYYKPLNEKGQTFDMRKVQPKTNLTCIDCKKCAQVCPMGSIDYDKVSHIEGICIKCGACVKICPTQAKYFDDADYLFHKKDLEEKYQVRKEPEFFL